MPRLRAMMVLSLATSLFVPAALAQNTNNARPGTINYLEGQATLNGQALTAKSGAELGQGQTVATTNGKVEVLLTPGVFLRIGENSSVTMVSPDLAKTEIQVNQGRAEVEVDQIFKQNDLLVDQGPAQTKLLKNGLYEFDATAGDMRVFDGEAAVSPSQNAQKWVKVKGHHELALNGLETKPQNFDGDQVASNDALYNWSKLRADYLGKANLDLAREYADNPAFAAGFYPGWYWNPGLYAYTWLPGDGLFWSPFGYGFYSPGYLYGGGVLYPGYRVGGFHPGYVHGPYHAGTVFRGGGGFHSGGHGAGGGFHGRGR